jgi:hypothetical protein
MRMDQTIPDSADTFVMHSLDVQDVSATQILRAGRNHPFKEDFVQGNDAATSFLVTWPISSDGSRESLTARILTTLGDLRENADVQITPPFHILDGRGDKLATVCVQTSR